MSHHKQPILFSLFLVSQIVFVDVALALSLEDMMSPSGATSTSNQQSKSLLGDVQNERTSRKTNIALKEYHSVNDEILRSCKCLNSGSCSQRWSSRVWNKSQSYITKEKQATKEKQRVCLSAITPTVGASSSLDKILSAKKTAIQKRNLLTNIDNRMVSKASSDRRQVKYKQKNADDRKAEIKKNAYRKRQREAQASLEAETDAAWADSPVFGNSNFSDKLQRIQDRTMKNIESQRATRHAQKPNQPTKNHQASTDSYMKKVIRICVSNGGVYNRSTNRCELQGKSQPKNSASYEAEKANCLAAGKKWQSGGGCDYSSTIKIQGWSKRKTTAVNPGSSSQPSVQNNSNASRSTAQNSPKPANKNNERRDGYKPNNKSKNHSSTGGSGKSNKKQDTSEVAMIVVRKENPHSWPTQEEACIYAKSKVINLAKKQCKLEYSGVPATTDDVPIPVHANCQSYRQMTKTGFTTKKGQWKTTGNVTFYCRLPKPQN